MTSIGGYFASLDLVTNASSFDRARRYFSGITSDADKATSAVDRLQEQISKSASSFFRGGASQPSKPNSYEQFKGYKINPQSGYMVDESEKEEQKRSQKKDYLTKIANLYVMMKLLTMLKDVAVKLANLTYAMSQANMKAYTGAIQANMSPNVMKAWKIAAEMNAQDASDMLSNFSSFNRAFVELGLGRGEAYGGVSQSMSLLSKTSGKRLDPKEMIGMTNDQRIAAVYDALREAYKKNSQLALQLAEDLLGPGMKGILAGDMTTGSNSFAKAYAAIQATISPEDVKVGQEFGLLKAGLKETMNLLGQAMGRQFLDEVDRLNKWLGENKDTLRKTMDDIGKAFQLIFDVLSGFFSLLGDIDAWFAKVNAELAKWIPVFGTPGDPSNGSAWSGITSQRGEPPSISYGRGGYGMAPDRAGGVTIQMTVYGVAGTEDGLRGAVESGVSRGMTTVAQGKPTQ